MSSLSFRSILWRTVMVHSVTYFLSGIIFSLVFNYAARMQRPDIAPIIRSQSDLIFQAGVLFQPIRAALLAVVFYLLRDSLFGKKRDWLIMWVLLVVLGILTPFGASWGSIEGMIFFNFPLWDHIVGWPEVFAQTLLLSVILTYWVDHPKDKRVLTGMSIGFGLTMLLPILNLVFTLLGKR